MLGVNTFDNTKKPVYTAEIYERRGLKRSKSMTNILLFEFLEDLRKSPKIKGGILKGKRVCFNTDLEIQDINYSRKLINSIYLKSGKYTADLTSANLFVYGSDLEEKRYKKALEFKKSINKRLEFISQSEFLALLGDITEIAFDDVKYLKRHEENRLKMKQKNEEEKRKAKQQSFNKTLEKPKKSV